MAFHSPERGKRPGELQRSLQNLKDLLTQEVNNCNDKINHFKLRFSDDYTTITVAKIGYAQNILDNHNLCSIRFLRELECNMWEGSDEELDAVL